MIGKFYEVEEIMGRRRIKNKYEYLIKWKGYKIEESTREPEEQLFTIKDLIDEYDQNCEKKGKKKKKTEKDEKNKEKNNNIYVTIDIKEEDENKNKKKTYFLLDNSIDKILGIKLEKSELVGIVERRNKDGKVFTEKISIEDIKKTNPWILVDFYESIIVFE